MSLQCSSHTDDLLQITIKTTPQKLKYTDGFAICDQAKAKETKGKKKKLLKEANLFKSLASVSVTCLKLLKLQQ